MASLAAINGIEKTSPLFRWKVIQIARRLGIDPDWLMADMRFETGPEPFSASVLNRSGSGAVGLIQFMPGTAKLLGTSTAELAKMTPEQQLDVVYQYFAPHAGKMHTLGDTYLAIFYPAAMGLPPEHVIFSEGTKGYQQNAGLDRGKKGSITVADVIAAPANLYAAAVSRPRIDVPDEVPTSPLGRAPQAGPAEATEDGSPGVCSSEPAGYSGGSSKDDDDNDPTK